MKNILVLALIGLLVCTSYAATRSGWIGGPADQGYLQFSDNGTNIVTFTADGVSISNAVLSGAKLSFGNIVAPGTNTGVLTACPAGTANAAPLWIKVLTTNGSAYAFPVWLLP